jgi:hypothetical protein
MRRAYTLPTRLSLAGVNYMSSYSLTPDDLRRIGGAETFVSRRDDPDGPVRSARQWTAWARQPKRLVLTICYRSAASRH